MERHLETVEIEFSEDTHIGRIVLNRPEKLNTLNEQLVDDLVEGLRLLEAENEQAEGAPLRAVILEGAGEKAFCAGADVDGFSEDSWTYSSSRAPGRFIREYPHPVIAKIQGYCLGGGLELALECDLRFASEGSEFGLPETGLGIIPGAGGIQYLVRLAGPAVAKELVMTGEHFPATRAEAEGLVNDVCPAAELDGAVEEVAESIAEQAPLAVQATKESVAMALQTGLDEGITFDNRISTSLLSTDDSEEGREAFAEDRTPEFEGK
jgi:enoyl-CoA hydratase